VLGVALLVTLVVSAVVALASAKPSGAFIHEVRLGGIRSESPERSGAGSIWSSVRCRRSTVDLPGVHSRANLNP
jgi:hypothetical protein